MWNKNADAALIGGRGDRWRMDGRTDGSMALTETEPVDGDDQWRVIAGGLPVEAEEAEAEAEERWRHLPGHTGHTGRARQHHAGVTLTRIDPSIL